MFTITLNLIEIKRMNENKCKGLFENRKRLKGKKNLESRENLVGKREREWKRGLLAAYDASRAVVTSERGKISLLDLASVIPWWVHKSSGV